MKRIKLSAIVALFLALLMLASCRIDFGVSTKKDNADETLSDVTAGNNNTTQKDEKVSSIVVEFLDLFSYYDYEFTDEELAQAIVWAYQQKTGDIYSKYYTKEEYEELKSSNAGDNQGIGITVIENTEYGCIEVISVLPNSPALAAGVMAGDLIVQVGIGDSAEITSDIGYEVALMKLQGAKDTICEFGIVRNGDFENIIEFSILRQEYTSMSVMYTTSAADPSVGIVKILNFDLTTPTQFCEAMDTLIQKGCNGFVFDVRYNPGGDLASIRAVLSYLLNPKDTIIIVTDSDGNEEITLCEPIDYGSGSYSSCNVTESDIGKYRNKDYEFAVIVNSSTASAAELFTGTLKAYGIATVVGETTYGKGCMQSIFGLSIYNPKFGGAIKMTTKYYRPYNTENYQGIGIMPSEGYEVKPNEEASNMNVYKLFETENQHLDNQLATAISTFVK